MTVKRSVGTLFISRAEKHVNTTNSVREHEKLKINGERTPIKTQEVMKNGFENVTR